MLVKRSDKENFFKTKFALSGTQIIAVGFIAIILAGALLLSLPVSSKSGTWTPPIDALFTATTATCVTGLVVADTYFHWSVFGQCIILLLIQIGGMGFMSIALLFSIALNKKIGLRQRLILSESISLDSIAGVVRMMKKVIICTVVFESLGALLLSIRFIPEFGFANGLFKSVFHSVSSFCNAGIDLMGEKSPYSSLTSYSGDTLVNLTVCALIVIGGLGFFVWEDLWHFFRKKRRLRLHSKLVLFITAILLAGGAILYFIFEYTNPDTMGNMSLYEKILASFFQSVTTRTAGSNTIDTNSLTNPSLMLTLFLMFIGGSPGSTAGGVKTTTIGLFFITARSVIRGSSQVQIWERHIAQRQVLRAVTIVVMAFIIIVSGTTLLCLFDNLPLIKSLFEVTSAFGTVGLTMNVTPNLSAVSKFIVILLMYLGRVGVLTAIFAIAKKQHNYESKISYPKEAIMF